jgi:hypothetical protein
LVVGNDDHGEDILLKTITKMGEGGLVMTRIAVLACLPVLLLGGPIAAQKTITAAGKTVDQYLLHEERCTER